MAYKFLSAAQIAEILSCSKTTVWRMAGDGRLPKPFKLGGISRWHEKDVLTAIGQTADAATESGGA